MRESVLSKSTEAVLLVDASNVFNSLNRDAALHNIRHVCPSLATVLINTYRDSMELFVDGLTLLSEEGTTQGDPLAMPMYAMATIPIINHLGSMADVKQVWYADDASAVGRLNPIRHWWDQLNTVGPKFGYHPNASKTWLLTKEEHLDQARTLFHDTQVNITTHGQPHLGAPLGCKEYGSEFVSDKVDCWVQELTMLANIAKSQPHAAHAGFTHGYMH